MPNWTLGPQDFRRTVEAEVREHVEAEYESRLAQAGPLHRLWLRLERWFTIQRETQRRLKSCERGAV